MAIVLIAGWFLLPDGYNDLIAIFAPQFGNFMRPTVVMVNLILVNPMSNFTMIAVWAGAGFVGGVMAGTKKGAFVVGLMVWLSCFGLIALFVYLLFIGGIGLGSFVVPPGSSIVDILGIPIIQGMIDQVLPLLSGLGGFDMSSILTLITPLLLWFFTPVIVVIVAAIVGAMVRPKEEF